MQNRWLLLKANDDEVAELSRDLGLPYAIARVLFLRGIRKSHQATRFLNHSLKDMQHPFDLSGMKAAAQRCAKATLSKETVFIHGDFDADGISSTALLISFFRSLGVSVAYYIPNRLFEGHGISLKALDHAKERGATLMITCDCGSSNAKEIEVFEKAGVDVIVTDHHHIGDSALTSAILVNPRQEDATQHEGLAGVGVAFMLAVAIRAELRDHGHFDQENVEPNLKELLDIVALGTVADLAPLVGQNRILVSEGLLEISKSKRPGILAMKKQLGLDRLSIDAEDIGFRLAPRINAAARLGHAEEALKLLTTQDHDEAHQVAQRLEGWNQERKNIQQKMFQIAFGQAEAQMKEGKHAIVVSSSEFHSGISGLVAQKLAEIFYAPAFVFSVEGELAKASARSRGGISIHRLLEDCKDMLIQYGGHDEAGGCSLETSKLNEFKARVETWVAVQEKTAKAIQVDAELTLDQVDPEFFQVLQKLRPFGMGNAAPTFLSRVKIAGPLRQVGAGHLKATFVGHDGRPFDAIGFGLWREEFAQRRQEDVEVIFSLGENTWQGRKSIQLILKAIC